MLALDTNHSYQLECAMALTRLIAQQSSDQPLLSNQHVRDIVRVMRVKLSECSFIGEMLNLVVNALVRSTTAPLSTRFDSVTDVYFFS